MHITNLNLTNYRNYSRLRLSLPTGPILFRGDNAQGKTNLLEAIAFLSTTRSVHARTDQHLINWLSWQDEMLAFSRVEATIQTKRDRFDLAITILREHNGLRKTIMLNGAKKRAMDVIGRLTTVLFLPEDIELVTGAPAVRRRYLDTTLCQSNPTYCHTLSQYNKVLTQRNALLKELFKRRGKPDQLLYWDELLTEHGTRITLERHEALLNLDVVARHHHRAMSDGQEGLRLCYIPSLNLYGKPKPNSNLPLLAEELAPYNTNAPSFEKTQQLFLNQLKQLQSEEIRRGITTIGPHRDEFLFLVDGVDMNLYGSRGQQRTAALSAKMAEIALMEQTTGETPILLLDDVMSELDANRRQQIINLVKQTGQSLLTTTDWDDFSEPFQQQAKRFTVNQGQVTSDETDITDND